MGRNDPSGPTSGASPGELLIHPVALAALVLLVVNDRVIKAHWPGFVSGKLSDLAGLVVFPLALCSLAEFVRRRCGREMISRLDAVGWTIFCGMGFAFVKLTTAGHDAYAWSVGALRWPWQSVADGRLVPLSPIIVTPDASDLIALAALPIAWLLIARRRHRFLS